MPGGHGGPLAFLNKKTWHPASFQNQEKVWKREQEAEREKKKLEELRKQMEEEKQKEELFQVAEAAGVRRKDERLDWMYASGMAARHDAEKRAEEQMLGQKPLQVQEEKEVPKADTLAALPSFYAEDTPASANETWARLHNDPLFAIKQQELAARKNVVSNPAKMMQLRQQVAAALGSAKAAKKAKKEKKQKKDKDKKKREAARSASPAPKRHRSASPQHKHKEAAAHDRPRHDSRRQEEQQQQQAGDRRRDHRDDRGHSSRQDHHDKPRADGQGHGSHHDQRARAKDRHEDSTQDRGSRPEVGGGGRKYGLDHAEVAPEAARQYDRSALAEATRKRLEEAAQRKEQEEKDKANQRYQRKEYRTGTMTAEERAAKLAAMQQAADEHEAQRVQRISDAQRKEEQEGETYANGRHDSDKFLKTATRAMHESEAASMADQVGRRKFYSDNKAGFRR